MAILIGAQDISKSYAERPLFKNLSFAIESKERIGLIGPNGAGKSTLLSILAGKVEVDSGKLSIQNGLKVGHLKQLPEFQEGSTVHSAILEGGETGEWEEMALSQELMAKLGLADMAESLVSTLSGGWRKRVALARELLKQPDLLLLDEPTNHLDVESIIWLEEFLERAPFATLTITHDRVFLQKVSNRIIEINRRYPSGLLSVRGDYISFLESKDLLLAQQESTELKLRNTLRRETEWLRQGAKARTTKQQARINRAGDLGAEVEELGIRNTTSSTRFDFKTLERNPKKLVHAEGISKSYAGNPIVPKMDLLITPKSRVGILGTNGCGKSTLIRLLLKLEEPDTGTVTHADSLKIAYFEQNRESLDPNLSVLRTICPRGDHVDYAGSRVHVRSYLDRFLFSGNQVDMLVSRLSGGEQSRLLLAQLMLEECNLMVLDEPTNDLDVVTLDLLQDVLQEFKGAVVLVTHDRYFLDQVANQILAFGDKKKIETFSNLAQWENWRERELEKQTEQKKEKSVSDRPKVKKKLSFKEQRELDGMEGVIEQKETRLKELTLESEKPEIASNATKLLAITEEMAKLQNEIEQHYVRWSELTADV